MAAAALLGLGIKFGIQEGIPLIVKLVDKLIGKGRGLEIKKPLAEQLIKTLNSSLINAGAPPAETIPSGAEALAVQEAVDHLNQIGVLTGKSTSLDGLNRIPEILDGIRLIADGVDKIIGRRAGALPLA